MRIFFFSDAHGYAEALSAFERHVNAEQPDLLCFLGDALYHGPRNGIQQDYAPQEAVAILNRLAPRMLAVRGNCDAEVDQMLLKFPCMETYATLFADGRRFFLTHGHKYDAEHLPPLPEDTIVATGHTHIPVLERSGARILLNPGSISLPKNGSVPSFAEYADGVFLLRELPSGQAYARLALTGETAVDL